MRTKKNSWKTSTCEVCKENKALGVFCVPSIPYTAAYCKECLEADAHPWGILVANTACVGSLDKCADFWKWMVTNTCEHLGRSLEGFKIAVELNNAMMNQYHDVEEPEDFWKSEHGRKIRERGYE